MHTALATMNSNRNILLACTCIYVHKLQLRISYIWSIIINYARYNLQLTSGSFMDTKTLYSYIATLYIYMCVCVYICTYIRTYVRTYVCMHVYLEVRSYICKKQWNTITNSFLDCLSVVVEMKLLDNFSSPLVDQKVLGNKKP